MDYIVLDLEWNQPLSYQSQVYKEVGDKLLFEMIQIGAVKVGSDWHVVDSLSIPIRPQKYVRIHPRIRKMTGLGPDELEDAPLFDEAMDQFLAWCGDDYTLLTWGCDDVSVLKQNMDFFGYERELPPLCDIQRLFSDVHQCRDRKGLKAAMEMLEIEPEEERAFHNAVHDAYYTALVFARLPDPAAVLNYPQQPKQLIHQRSHEEHIKGKNFPTIQAALDSQEATALHCPVCGKSAVLEEEGYVPQTADKYVGLAKCPNHGWMLSRLRFVMQDDGSKIMSVKVVRASQSNRAYVHTKRLQVQQKQADYLTEYGTLPDPDEALRRAERSSMPFDD